MQRWLGGDRETLTGQGFRKVKLQDIYTGPDIQRVVMGILDSPSSWVLTRACKGGCTYQGQAGDEDEEGTCAVKLGTAGHE